MVSARAWALGTASLAASAGLGLFVSVVSSGLSWAGLSGCIGWLHRHRSNCQRRYTCGYLFHLRSDDRGLGNISEQH